MGATWNPAQDMPNLTGKIALVTGASTGIGFQIVRRLAQRGAKVFATTRSEEKAEKARDALKTRHPDIPAGAIEWLPLDLTNLQRISEVSEEIRSKADRLDVLGKLLQIPVGLSENHQLLT
ncbi:hypothetical protein EV126DRAFT_251112 [Verticillium dahliae]|nr:hypothetical protein EV126DRAFT_251112 [Verticillium dahliae]